MTGAELAALAEHAAEHPETIGEAQIAALARGLLEAVCLADHFRERTFDLTEQLESMLRAAGAPGYEDEVARFPVFEVPEGVACCSVCSKPAHPADTDDAGRCVSCIVAAGETPIFPSAGAG